MCDYDEIGLRTVKDCYYHIGIFKVKKAKESFDSCMMLSYQQLVSFY